MPAKVFRGDKAKELLDYAHSELNASARQKELTLEAAEAVAFLASFQMELSQANYEGIGSNPTVSIGVCEVTSQSVLTERQVEEWAATAKQFAKDAGRNRIAGVSGLLPDKDPIRILHPQQSERAGR